MAASLGRLARILAIPTPAGAWHGTSAPSPGPSPPEDGVTGRINVSGVSKIFEQITGRQVTRTHALTSVSFDVESHEFLSIVGPSGCGKSTVMKMIAGLLHPTTGCVSISGREITGPGPDRACVFQSPALMPWKTAVQNIDLALEFNGVPKAERTTRAPAYIDLVGLGPFSNRYPRELSGGMEQRVALARALAVEPDTLLMDEPFGALDALTRTQMQEELLRIWEQTKKTVVFITHSIEEAVVLSDRVLVMGTGTLESEIPIALSRPRSRRELLSDPKAIELMRQLETLLDDAHEGGH